MSRSGLAYNQAMRCIGVSLVALSWVVLASATVRAQGADDKPGKQKQADELFEQGRKLLNGEPPDPQGACDKFNEAIKLDPEAPGTMLNLGLCNEKLSKYKTALYWFRKAQARAAETNLPDYEKAAKDHTIDLATKVATIKISFATPPTPDTKVKIDGEEVKPDEYLHAEVDPGHHTLVAGQPGKKIVQQEFDVEGRGGQTLDIEFVEGENAIVIDRGAGRRKAAVFLAIGGGILWGGALGVSLWAKGHYSDYAHDGTLNTDPPPADPKYATDQANHYQYIARWVGTPIFVGGALAISGAFLLYLTAPDKERIDRTVFAPSVGPDHLGLAVSGGF
jgi:hypothetical protein